MGDPAGIGPEIIVKLAARREDFSESPVFVIGDAGTLRRAAAVAGTDVTIRLVESVREVSAFENTRTTLAVLQTGPEVPADLPFGRVDAVAGAASHAYVVRAAELALGGEVSAIVTAPINKAALKSAGVSGPGHTEILAEQSGTREFAMMLVTDHLRVLLVSVHVALAEAVRAITPENERRAIRFAYDACRSFGIDRPRIAVAGLNPHTGEDGMFGNEEIAVIAPAVAWSRALRLNVSGPYSADTVFMRARQGHFDVVVAQYHDQGLIPLKLLGIDQGANITIGLPFVRTSVDHGTAFDIAGKGTANHASLEYALRQARRLIASRSLTAPATSG